MHYSQLDFKKALINSGIKKGDLVFGHSNIGFFGIPSFDKNKYTSTTDMLLETFLEILGPEGTLILPAYTYSFCNGKIFDPEKDKGIGGMLSEYLRQKKESIRSIDPSISVVAIGAKAEKIISKMPINAYSSNGFFQRLLNENGKICNLNKDASSTFIHYIEKMNNVPYRYEKEFKGEIRINNKLHKSSSIIYVRFLHPSTEVCMKKFDYYATEKKACKKIKVGRGFIKTMSIKDQLDIGNDLLKQSIWNFTRAGNDLKIPNPKELIK